MQSQKHFLKSNTETLFTTKDPFYEIPQRSSHYHSSNQQPVYDSSIVLTPDKKKVFSFEELGNYSPLNYSISQEDLFLEKLEEIPKFSKIILQEQSDICGQRLDITEECKGSSKSSTPNMALTEDKKNSESNLSRLVDRFRYGKPLPPTKRPSLNSTNHSLPLIGTSKIPIRQSGKLPINTREDEKIKELQNKVERILQESELSNLTPLSGFEAHSNVTTPHFTANNIEPEFMNSNLGEKILPKTYYPISDETRPECYDSSIPSMTSFTSPVKLLEVPVLEKPTVHSNNPENSQYKCTNKPYKPSYSSINQIDGHRNDILQIWRLRRKIEEAKHFSPHNTNTTNYPTVQHQLINQPSYEHLLCHSQQPSHQKQPQQNHYIPLEDIPNSSHPVSSHPNYNPCLAQCFNPPPSEKPFIQTPDMRLNSSPPPSSVVVKRSPEKSKSHNTVSTETQTTPEPVLEPVSDGSNVNIKHVKDKVDLHKVTLVKGTSAQTDSPQSPTWTNASTDSINLLKNTLTREKAQFSKVKEDGSKSSPISTMVKQVVTTRLFDIDSSETISSITTNKTPQKSLGQSFIESSSSIQNNSDSSCSPNSNDEVYNCAVVENQQSVLQCILRGAENDPLDFKEDLVLQSLRQQRSNFIAQLRKLDVQLENLDKK